MGRGIGAPAGLATATLMLAGMLAGLGGSPPAAAAGGPDCPSPPVTIQDLIRLVHGPESFDPRGRQVLACLGGRQLTFQAYVPDLPRSDGRGGTSTTTISPRWLDGLKGSAVALSSGPGGPEIGAFVPPALGRCSWYTDDFATCPFRWYWGRWATITAHFDGPVARTCRYTPGSRGDDIGRRDAVLWCRTQLIVLSVGPIEPPATTTAGLIAEIPAAPPTRPVALGLFALGSLLLAGRLTARRPQRRGNAPSGATPARRSPDAARG
jgi:hypothetical protein